MKKMTSRLALLALLAGLVTMSGASGPTAAADGFQDCPFPPCMAPCAFPPAPEVVCKDGKGNKFITSFTCCCCGGGGNCYKPL